MVFYKDDQKRINCIYLSRSGRSVPVCGSELAQIAAVSVGTNKIDIR
jgi:hypothetical protein